MAAACVACVAAAGANDLFRPLEIGGAEVRWLPKATARPVTLTYAIADRDMVIAAAINCGRIGAPRRLLATSRLTATSFRDAARQSFARWQAAANLAFREVEDAAQADIVIGEQTAPQGVAFTNLELAPATGSKLRGIAKAQICLNPEKRWNLGFDGVLTTYDLVHAITHEIGHAIGLDHPGARGHLMSFRYLEAVDGLSEGDALGAISLYGARQSPTDRANLDASLHIVR